MRRRQRQMCIRDSPKGVMDPHEIPASDARVGKLPEEVYDWMRPESNENKDKISNQTN